MNKRLIGGIIVIICVVGIVAVPIVVDKLRFNTIVDRCALLRDGNGITEATEYSKFPPGPHRIVLLNMSGEKHEWTDKIPEEWKAKSIDEVELVVFVLNKKKHIETCWYNVGPLNRYQHYLDVELWGATTGTLLDGTTFYGSMPEECKPRETFTGYAKSKYGSSVPLNQLTAWLEPFVMPADRTLQPMSAPLLHFSFELESLEYTEGEFRVYDISPAPKNTGIIHGAGFWPGKVGNTMRLYGKSDYVEVYPFDYDFTEITTEFWMQTSDTTKEGTILSGLLFGQTADEYLISDYRNFHIYIGGDNYVETGISANDGKWHHIVITWQSSHGSIKLYKDGIEAYVGILEQGRTIHLGNLVLGQDQDEFRGGFDSSQAFLGLLDEVRIYNRALSHKEVVQHYKAESGTLSLQ